MRNDLVERRTRKLNSGMKVDRGGESWGCRGGGMKAGWDAICEK